MVKNYARHVAKTPQTSPVPGKAMVQNPAGGYTFAIDDWQRLRRFLILGSEGGTYYAGERELTLENVECLLRCLKEDGNQVVNMIANVSVNALAPKNDPAIFALAVASVKGNDATRQIALSYVSSVCRTGTHLFQFAEARQAVGGGWGRGVRRAVADWYLQKPVDKLVHQCLKYRQRDGWSHRDLLRLAHPNAHLGKPDNTNEGAEQRAAVFDAVCAPDGGQRWSPSKEVNVLGSGGKSRERELRGVGEGWSKVAEFSKLAEGYLKADGLKPAADAKPAPDHVRAMAKIVADFKLERELVPTEYLNLPEVQEAMLPNLGLTALVRNLGNMSKSGFLKPLSQAEADVVKWLSDVEALKKSRVHPFQLLLAARTYASGKSVRGSGAWMTCPKVVDALDQAFYDAFHNVEPTGKRHLLGVDVSGSMSMPQGGTVMSCAEAAAAMSLVTMKTEPNAYAFGFSTQFVDLGITARSTLQSVLKRTTNQNFGGTDCAVAIEHALKHKLEVDAFVIYTDSETWAGERHAFQALQAYRRATGIQARLAVVAFTATDRSVGDPSDPLSMDFVGMDASLPQALAAFVKGEA